MAAYKLTYFDVRVRGEPIRLLFALAGQDFEDIRIKDWEKWMKMKPDTPFSVVPILEHDGLKLCQSNTILRYLGDTCHYSGSSPREGALAQMITACTEDMVKPTLDIKYYLYGEDKQKQAEEWKKYFDKKFPVYLTHFEKLLKGNNGGDGYFVGKKITYADVAVFHWITWIMAMGRDGLAGQELSVKLEDYPKLKAHSERVATQPGIAEWLKEYPVTQQ